jgi:hypothetical protein
MTSIAVRELRAEIDLYRSQNLIPPWVWEAVCDENDQLRAEIERLREQRVILRSAIREIQFHRPAGLIGEIAARILKETGA